MNKIIIGILLMLNGTIFAYYYSMDNMNAEEKKENKFVQDLKNETIGMSALEKAKAMKGLDIRPISFMGPTSKEEVLKMFYWSVPFQIVWVFMFMDLQKRKREEKK